MNGKFSAIAGGLMAGMMLFSAASCGGAESGSAGGSSRPSESVSCTEHEYALSDDGMSYVCGICGDEMPSGAAVLKNNGAGFKAGADFTARVVDPRNYMFVGSSISYGHLLGFSMVDMIGRDYLIADYTVARDGAEVSEKGAYMYKTETKLGDNADGFGGTYKFDYDTVVLDGSGGGTFNGEAFSYAVTANEISLSAPVGGVTAFTAKYYNGDNVYKFCENGDSLSDADPRYTTSGMIALDRNDNPDLPGISRRSYVGLMELALQEHADERMDAFFVQLSLNDVWQFTAPYAQGNEQFVSLGEIREDQWSGFDTATSFGALEWIISKAKETWGCEIVLYSCPMSTDDWNKYVSVGKDYDRMENSSRYAQMRTGLLKAAEKWGCQVIDMWGDAEGNETLRGNYDRYYIDGTHVTLNGYERVLYQAFRQKTAALFPIGGSGGDETLYTVVFKDGETVVSEQKYSPKNNEVYYPYLAGKAGYSASWEKVTLDGGDKVINAVYTPAEYFLTLKVDKEIYRTITFTAATEEIVLPPIPLKEGYEIVGWEIDFFPKTTVSCSAVYKKLD